MGQRWTLDTTEKRAHFDEYISQQILAGKTPVVEFVANVSKPQFDAAHVWFRHTAEHLNESGLEMHVALAARKVEVPWTEVSFKEQWWKPVLKVMTEKPSTTEQDTKECLRVQQVLYRHFAETHDIALPSWPTRSG